ncbi:bifunctional hydroxymethylpyrimidine kinase/phosphomethylpyrimidine kinase [Curvibacter sp. APW13]|uniref:bifunctional hydroxymethylpyrimidine kinase/phosphomethylpyrimidine kinase n=1 Tax=Curvibacter sp. APW13 TaxID=3077236 RepID=UPI0028DD7ABB|nr:bifunctional hydroxymethylpyrimidine kinase/phosphomethylpyrimidine kinase [Curvibacter sp. APW13]MDT8989706.1 bifunctional hydroxymethylpyrimidine kinase/phosphomethylpyrimidine kinase [Curvibacter sp. APW13]
MSETDHEDDEGPGACVLVFNANDPSAAGGLAADISAVASIGVHALPVVSGTYIRDTAEVVDHYAFDDEALGSQARTILEDVPVQAIKVGFVGSPENLAVVAEIASDYSELPLIAYLPDLSWWKDDLTEAYLDACTELLLPQTTVLVGSHTTLSRWLLPDWVQDKPPAARDIAKAASEFGVPYTLVTGIALPDQFIDNILAAPHAALCSHKYERFDAHFIGAGETLSAALAALIASGTELTEAVAEALGYLDQCLGNGFRPGMGHVLPDRMFWAQPESDDDADEDGESASIDIPPNATRH